MQKAILENLNYEEKINRDNHVPEEEVEENRKSGGCQQYERYLCQRKSPDN
jgi:hypothetical protein